MDGTNPKISFIPKGSLVREESFLERSRPRSVIGFIAITFFTLVFGAFIVLSYLNNSLNGVISEKTIEIKKVQKEFSNTPEVGDAKLFRARADLARELLNAHLVASPVFEFLATNTVSSVSYDKFSFKNMGGVSTLDLSGEAQNYAGLAYQVDVLKQQTKVLSGLFVSEVALTNFGSVTFTISLIFNPDFLLYTKNLSNLEISTPTPSAALTPVLDSPGINFDAPTQVVAPTPVVVPAVSSSNPQVGTTTNGKPATSASSSASSPLVPSVQATTTTTKVPVKTTAPVKAMPVQVATNQSFLSALWLKFKFW